MKFANQLLVPVTFLSHIALASPLFKVTRSNFSLAPDYQYSVSCWIYEDKIERITHIPSLKNPIVEKTTLSIKNAAELEALTTILVNADDQSGRPGPLGSELKVYETYSSVLDKFVTIQEMSGEIVISSKDTTVLPVVVNLIDKVCK